MNNMKRIIIIYIVSLVSGILSSLIVSGYIAEKLWEQSGEILFAKNVLAQRIYENATNHAIFTIELLDSGDINQIDSMNCKNLQLVSKHIDLDDYNDLPARQMEILNLKEKANEIYSKLTSKGLCSE